MIILGGEIDGLPGEPVDWARGLPSALGAVGRRPRHRRLAYRVRREASLAHPAGRLRDRDCTGLEAAQRHTANWSEPGSGAAGKLPDGAHEPALAVRSRLLGKPEDDFRDAPPRRRLGNLLTLGWLGPLFFTAVGGIMRFWHVGAPHQLIFDETYYVSNCSR